MRRPDRIPKHLLRAFKKKVEEMTVGVKRSGVIMIACPTHRGLHPQAFGSLRKLEETFLAQGTGLATFIHVVGSAMVVAARNAIVERFMEFEDGIGILFVDDDMSYPCDDGYAEDGTPAHGFNPLMRLMGRETDIVGALCTTRRDPVELVGGWQAPDGVVSKIVDEEVGGPGNADPFEVDFVGFGMVFIRKRVFEAIHKRLGVPYKRMFCLESNWRYDLPGREEIESWLLRFAEEKPAVGIGADRLMDVIDTIFRRNDQLSEDYSFCRKAKDAGMRLLCDPSFMVMHHGDYAYSRLDWLARVRSVADWERVKAEQDTSKPTLIEVAAG